jgi:hypothetical protein
MSQVVADSYKTITELSIHLREKRFLTFDIAHNSVRPPQVFVIIFVSACL